MNKKLISVTRTYFVSLLLFMKKPLSWPDHNYSKINYGLLLHKDKKFRKIYEKNLNTFFNKFCVSDHEVFQEKIEKFMKVYHEIKLHDQEDALNKAILQLYSPKTSPYVAVLFQGILDAFERAFQKDIDGIEKDIVDLFSDINKN